MKQMTNIRTYQLGFMFFGFFAYLFVYRRFIAGKSVMGSVVYHQTLTYLKQSKKIKSIFGEHMQIMDCNGKMWPLSSDVNFDIIIFGS